MFVFVKLIFVIYRSKFNIIFYGYGSKRQILNDFAQTHLDSHHHYVVIKGYSLEITLKHVRISLGSLKVFLKILLFV